MFGRSYRCKGLRPRCDRECQTLALIADRLRTQTYDEDLKNGQGGRRGQVSLFKLVGAIGFEPTTPCAQVLLARRISNLHGMGSGSTEWESLVDSVSSATLSTRPCNSIRVGTGHKIGHRESRPQKKNSFSGEGHPSPFPFKECFGTPARMPIRNSSLLDVQQARIWMASLAKK